MQSLGENIWSNGGILAAVCHGGAIFDGMVDKANDKPLLQGKSITGFTDIGEAILGVDGIMKENGLQSIEEMAKKYGAKYLASLGPWNDYSVSDGKLITGVNLLPQFPLQKDLLLRSKQNNFIEISINSTSIIFSLLSLS